MALTENPKLALIPSGYKASKVYSVLPSDGVGDFDFSRSGNATRINKDGLIETVTTNVPRLNYPLIDGVVSGCPSLLLEPSRTNLITYSEDIASFSQFTNATAINNQTISPDGTLNASLVTADAINSRHEFQNANITFTSGTYYTVSVFVKANGYDYFAIKFASTGSVFADDYAWFNVSNGTIGTVDADIDFTSIENYGNGWYRVTASQQANADASGKVFFAIGSADNTPTFLGDGASGLYVWGAMIEQGSYPTSYIPSLTGSQTTRSAETCNGAGDANTFNDSEGVLMAEISAFQETPTTNAHIVLRNSASTDFSNSILIQHRNDGALRIYADGFATGNIQFIVTDINWLVNNKIAIQYDSIGSNYKLFLNGTTKARYSSAANQSVVGLNDISFYWGSVNNPFYGNTKQIQYFDKALSDTDLEELTSWTSFNEMAESQLYSIQ